MKTKQSIIWWVFKVSRCNTLGDYNIGMEQRELIIVALTHFARSGHIVDHKS